MSGGYSKYRFHFEDYSREPEAVLIDDSFFYELNEAEEIFVEHYKTEGYDVYKLLNCGADFLLIKDDEHIILEVKTTLSRSSVSEAIIQILYAKGIIEKDMTYSITDCIIGYIYNSGSVNNKSHMKTAVRYLNHFKIRTEKLSYDQS